MLGDFGEFMSGIFQGGGWVIIVTIIAGVAGAVSGGMQDGAKGAIKTGIIGAVFFGAVAWAINKYALGG